MSMVVKGEGLIRLEAERQLLGRFKAEYERLRTTDGHVEAVKVLVATRKRDYDACIRDARAIVLGSAAAA
jgi:hypothetical protein